MCEVPDGAAFVVCTILSETKKKAGWMLAIWAAVKPEDDVCDEKGEGDDTVAATRGGEMKKPLLRGRR
jgi:hypothetical protein